MARRPALCAVVIFGILGSSALTAAGGRSSIATADLKEWLTYIASDELEGRAVFTDGLGLAAGYISSHLQAWGVKPAGDRGTYLQMVKVRGVRATSRSSVVVRIGSETRTFRDGDGVMFPRNSGANRTLTLDRVEFVGYGLDAVSVGHTDFKDRNVDGTAVIFLGTKPPIGLEQQNYRRLLGNRSRHARDRRALATIGPRSLPSGESETATGSRASGRGETADFTTTDRLDLLRAPEITAGDAFFEFLFSKAATSYDALKKKAADQETLPRFRLNGVSITFNVDMDYTVVRTQLTQNVVGIVEGSDPRLKATYVAFGAHYDHVGYAEAELTSDGRRQSAPGRVTPGTADDRIWNGADDDGSGTVALMAIARAFQEGLRPKRSLLFVWHAGEERGLYGSRYFADNPVVPLDAIVAQLNIDMIGRNRNDQPSESNSVYLVGSDRISSELHQLNRDVNRSLPEPLTLDYEFNDASDLEQIYYRSDHYSYAAKGIPVIFFTTGLHPDYHANTDEVSKIEFPKLTRIAQLVFETGLRLGNLDHAPARDFKGARAGKGTVE